MRPKTSAELQEAIVLRHAGHTLSSIAEKTSISPSTLYRAFKTHSVKRGGISQEAIDQAKEQLLNDAGFLDSIKHQVASQIADDLALSRQIREQTLLALEQLQDEPIPSTKARSLAALATTCKITSDIQRRALRLDAGALNEVQELPQLVVECMTPEEVAAIQRRFDGQEKEVSDDLPLMED